MVKCVSSMVINGSFFIYITVSQFVDPRTGSVFDDRDHQVVVFHESPDVFCQEAADIFRRRIDSDFVASQGVDQLGAAALPHDVPLHECDNCVPDLRLHEFGHVVRFVFGSVDQFEPSTFIDVVQLDHTFGLAALCVQVDRCGIEFRLRQDDHV